MSVSAHDDQDVGTGGSADVTPLLLIAQLIPLVLVVVYLLIAAILRWTPLAHQDILPWWTKIILYDVVTEADIHEERLESEKLLEQQAQEDASSASPHPVQSNAGDDERTPLLQHKLSRRTTSSRRQHRSFRDLKNFLLASLAMLQLLGTVASIAYDFETSIGTASSLFQASHVVTWLYAFLRPMTRKSPTPPYDLLTLYIAHAVLCIVSLHAAWAQRQVSDVSALVQAASLLLTAGALATVFSMPLTGLPTNDPVSSSGRPPAAEDRCTLWQWMTFSWASPIVNLAIQRTIQAEDVWQLSETCKSSILARKFKEASNFKSVPRRILAVNGHDMFLDFALTLTSSVLSYAPPFFLKRILEAIEGNGMTGTTKSTAYLYAVLSFATMILKSQADLQHLFYGRRASVRTRGQLIASIYEKALRTRDMNASLSSSNKRDGIPDSKSKQQPSQNQDDDSASDDDNSGIGKVVSLAAVDSIRIAAQCAGVFQFYSAPIEIIVASLFLYNLLGWSAFAGFVILILASPLQTHLTKKTMDISKRLSAARDKRNSALNELTQNLKFVKYYAFEEEMQRRILAYREKELSWLRKRQILQSFVMALWTLTPALVTTLSFASYVYISQRTLDVSTAFTAIALFQLLRGPLNNLPMQINELSNAKVCADRIDEFLRADEVPNEVSSIVSEAESRSPFIVEDGRKFGCQEATFKWPAAPVSDPKGAASGSSRSVRNSLRRVVSRFFRQRLEDDERHAHTTLLPHGHHDSALGGTVTPDDLDQQDEVDDSDDESRPFQLRDITFFPPKGRLSLVIGPTGSGKSALLTALLGEMDQTSGRSYLLKDSTVDPRTGLSHSIAYCAQSPWLQHASIRQNILFGQPYELNRYEAVLDACALRPDLEILDGDSTEIGEKGISLSGGQQARVALARAVYSRAAIVLLDDPLSAVDAHTAAKLVQECFNGPLMQGRTTVLVTHHAELILGSQSAAWVAKMHRGTIVAQGTVEELATKGEITLGNSGAMALKETAEDKAVVPGDSDGEAGHGNHAATKPCEGTHKQAHPRRLVEEESRAVGGVKKEVYKMYLDAVGWTIAAFVILFLIAFKCTDLAEKGWLAVWGASYRRSQDFSLTTSAETHSFVPYSGSDIWLAIPGFGSNGVLSSPWLLSAHRHLRDRPHRDQVPLLQSQSASTLTAATFSSSPFPPAYISPTPYLVVFFLINVASAAFVILSALFTYYGSLRASRTLFTRMLVSTMGATTRWLDKTPSGRIVNKFSRDIDVVDSSINNSLRYFASFVIAGAISVLTIVVVLPSFIIPSAILGAMNYYVAHGYVRAARDLRRLESVSRSPIFSAFSELLQGITTVRAFAAEKRLLRECTDRIDLSNSFFLYFWMSNRWLLFRLDVLGAVAIFLATVASLYGTIAAGLAGLALTQAQALIQAGYWMARFYTTLEQDANSIERIREALDEVPQEPASINEEYRPPAAWPAQGRVEVRDLVLRYAPELPPVLHGITFTIAPGEKVGIVGRTGSGKSTTALAFFRFVEFDKGSIHIDDVDISRIGLYDLRSRLTIIPQNAVLFSGTIRDNLDPFGQHSDEECLNALQKVNFRTTPISGGSGGRSTATSTPVKDRSRATSPAPRASVGHLQVPTGNASKKAEFRVAREDGDSDGSASPALARTSQTFVSLDSRVSEGGNNYSQGQRQLLAMARALLRNSQVILMDEASSAVDFATDSLIQSTIRTAFAHATVITIAHRLHTVAHADKVLVLDNGRVKEFASPASLMKKEGSAFYGMCKKSGDWDSLWEAAVERKGR